MCNCNPVIVPHHIQKTFTMKKANWDGFQLNFMKPSKKLHKHTIYFNNPRLKTLSLTTTATQQTSHRRLHSHYKRHKDPVSLVTPVPNSEQINLPSSNHTYTRSTPKHIQHHYAPLVTSTHTTSLQLHPHTHHIVIPGFVDRPRWERGSCWLDGGISWLVDQKWDDRTSSTNKGQGSGYATTTVTNPCAR